MGIKSEENPFVSYSGIWRRRISPRICSLGTPEDYSRGLASWVNTQHSEETGKEEFEPAPDTRI